MLQHEVMTTYARLPVSFEKGEGVWLYDDKGQKYLDALSGIGVCNLGHCHPAVTDAITRQAGKLVHTSNLYHINLQEQLAKVLSRISGMDSVFFSNSGAEANEAAIKIARLYGHKKGIKEPAIVVTEGSFHGRTMATLSATGNRKVQAGFEPLVPGFVRAPFDDIESIRQIAQKNPKVVAVMVEPIQGESGVNMPADDYLKEIRSICDKHDLLMILDEVQTGNGRTGTYFAYQQYGFLPDVVTTAKGLGNGFPIGACLAKGKAATTFQPGNHGSTYGGNPLGCAVALAVVNTLEKEVIPAVNNKGDLLVNVLHSRLRDLPAVKSIHGKGLMVGIHLDRPCTELVSMAMNKNILLNVASETKIRLLPPLVIEEQEIRHLGNTVADLVEHLLNAPAAQQA